MEKNIQNQAVPTEAWLRKRTVTSRIYAVQLLLLGIEYSVVFITLWVYVNTLVDTDHPKIIYSFASAAYLVSSIAASFPVGRWADCTRKTKTVLAIGNGLIICGNMVYSLPFSPYLLIAGRFIAGVGSSSRSVIIGEVFRSYKAEESISVISVLGIFFGVGFLTGPAINFIFLRVRFNIYSWKITDANIAGIYMAVLFLTQVFLIMFYGSNLSKEFDLKGLEEEENSEVANSTLDNEKARLLGEKREFSGEEPSLFKDTKKLLKFDIVVILLLTFHFMFLVTTLDLWLPMIIVDVLSWTQLEVDAITFSWAVIATLTLICFVYKKISQQQLYYFFGGTILAMICGLAILDMIKIYHKNFVLLIALWCIFCVLFALIGVAPLTFLPSCLAQMVPSSIQTYAESVRIGFSLFGSLIALLTSVYLFKFLGIFVIVHGTTLFFWVALFFIRRKNLMKPNVN